MAKAIDTLSFDTTSGEWQRAEISQTTVEVTVLKGLSFNIRKEKDYLSERMEALSALIATEAPDVIFIQENTKAHAKLLLAVPLLREKYYTSSFEGQGPGFKVSLWSTFPMNLSLVFLKGRPCILGKAVIGQAITVFASVHLTSGSNSSTRHAQVLDLFQLTSFADCCVVAGDFNMNGELENKVCNSNGFSDSWPKVHGADAVDGNTRVSHMGSFRLDRVLVRGNMVCESIRVIGKESVAEIEWLTISDHFGLGFVLKA